MNNAISTESYVELDGELIKALPSEYDLIVLESYRPAFEKFKKDCRRMKKRKQSVMATKEQLTFFNEIGLANQDIHPLASYIMIASFYVMLIYSLFKVL